MQAAYKQGPLTENECELLCHEGTKRDKHFLPKNSKGNFILIKDTQLVLGKIISFH